MSFFVADKLLNVASKTTGLDDFGEDDFIEPLDIMLKDYQSSASLNRLGAAGALIYLHRVLCNRLRLNHYADKYSLENEQITAPIFILGLPRTGSTLLHELLASHPALRAPTFWEATFVPGKSPFDRLRQLMTHVQIRVVDLISPGFRGVHKLGTFLPHECITLQAPSLRSMQFHAAHNLKTYNEWLANCDWQPAYRYHKRYLQWLQHGKQNQRWVLKAPGHLLSLDELYRTYPDAKIIQLHRDPLEVIPSMASLFLHLRRPFSGNVDLSEIGRDVTEQWAQGLDGAMAHRASTSSLNKQCLDINYRELVEAPLAVSKQVLAFAGVESTSETDRCLSDYVENHPQGKHGRHQYALDQFGLVAEDLRNRFSDYTAQYVNASAN